MHYIDAHHYKPPDIFIEATMACPEMRSMDYFRMLLANGGRSLVRRMRAGVVEPPPDA